MPAAVVVPEIPRGPVTLVVPLLSVPLIVVLASVLVAAFKVFTAVLPADKAVSVVEPALKLPLTVPLPEKLALLPQIFWANIFCVVKLPATVAEPTSVEEPMVIIPELKVERLVTAKVPPKDAAPVPTKVKVGATAEVDEPKIKLPLLSIVRRVLLFVSSNTDWASLLPTTTD